MKQSPVATLVTTTAAVASVFAACVGATPACAQTGAARTAPAPVVNARPDVQVVVMPMPGGQWAVSEVYASQVSQAKAIERLADLFKYSKWAHTSPPMFEDAALDAGSFRKTDATAAPPVMSSVRCTVQGNLTNPAQGTIDVLPFFASLREMNRVNVVFLSPFPTGTPYHGLQHFDSPQITVDQTGTQGTYLFVANIKDHSAAPLSLNETRAENKATSASRLSVLPFLFGLAVAVGLLVYYWATRFVGGGSRR